MPVGTSEAGQRQKLLIEATMRSEEKPSENGKDRGASRHERQRSYVFALESEEDK